VNWIRVDKNTFQWQGLVNVVMKLRVPNDENNGLLASHDEICCMSMFNNIWWSTNYEVPRSIIFSHPLLPLSKVQMFSLPTRSEIPSARAPSSDGDQTRLAMR
jgi:hypothetical protein